MEILQIITGIAVGMATVTTLFFTLKQLDKIAERDRDRAGDGSLRI